MGNWRHKLDDVIAATANWVLSVKQCYAQYPFPTMFREDLELFTDTIRDEYHKAIDSDSKYDADVLILFIEHETKCLHRRFVQFTDAHDGLT